MVDGASNNDMQIAAEGFRLDFRKKACKNSWHIGGILPHVGKMGYSSSESPLRPTLPHYPKRLLHRKFSTTSFTKLKTLSYRWQWWCSVPLPRNGAHWKNRFPGQLDAVHPHRHHHAYTHTP